VVDDARSALLADLLARRHRSTGTPSYYRCWTPGPVPLHPIIGAVRPLAEATAAFTPDRRIPGKTIIRVTEGEQRKAGI
jgi:hypothetical protein